MFVVLLWECIHNGQAEKFAWQPTVGIEPATFGILVQCSTNWATVNTLIYIDIEETRLSSKISPTRTDLTT